MITIVVKNTSGTDKIWAGKTMTPGEEYTLPTTPQRTVWQNDSNLLTAIANGEAQIGNGLEFFTDVNTAINHLKSTAPSRVDAVPTPFASKVLPNGKRLFRRIHGLSIALDGSGNQQSLTFTIPYVQCLMTATNVVGAQLGDRLNFKILDTVSGTVSGVPNYQLNQFGFNVYLSKDFHEEKSEYDSELFLGLQIKIEYTPVDAVARNVYFNITLHELL